MKLKPWKLLGEKWGERDERINDDENIIIKSEQCMFYS
jgi:hypothetical protein